MIVVTGAAGFICSCVVGRLNEAGHDDLIIVDEMVDGDLKQANLENKKYARYYDKKEFLDRVLNHQLSYDVKAVIHMGACSSTTLSDADYYEQNNYAYTRHLAQWTLAQGIRLIYASSAATYGDGTFGYSDDEALLPQLQPLNLYGHSKHKFDLWALSQGLFKEIVGLKFFNVFGPNEYHKGDMRSVIAKTYDHVVRDGKIGLFKSYRADYADGEQKRDFIYIKDAVDIVMYFFNNPGIAGIFNVGTGQARSWNDLAKALFAAVGQKPFIEYIEMPAALQSRYQYFTQADMAKLRSSGYKKDFFSLEEAVKDYGTYLKDKRCI